MNHYASGKFWRQYRQLPKDIQKLARRNYKLLRENSSHPSLHHKSICGGKFRSIRIGIHYQAIGIPVSGGVQWFWIGSHAEYDKLLG